MQKKSGAEKGGDRMAGGTAYQARAPDRGAWPVVNEHRML